MLVIIAHYLPGFKSGGPVRSIEGLAEHLGDEIDIYVLTVDRDAGDTVAYPGVRTRTWNRIGKAFVMYMPGAYRTTTLTRVMKRLDPDTIYLNTFFSVRLAMMPLLVRRWRCPDAHAIIAPRGELSEAALNLKKWKKLPFLRLVRLSGVLRGITWQASSQGEADDISLRIGSSAKVVIAPNLQRELRAQRAPQPKRSGLLRAIFISRISPKKNLPFLLEVLMTVRGRVDLDIIGPTEDANYWRRCLAEIERLPSNVAVTYRGEMAHDLVAEQLASHDLLVLPTLNENFGHVILEALSVGTPVLISDRTPWRGLASTYAGWDLDLARPQDFRAALEQCIAMDDSEFGKMSAAARERARLWTRTSKAVEANRQLFVGDQVDGRLGPGGTGDGSAPTRSETRGAQLLRTTTAGSGRRGESHVSRSASQEVD